MKEELNTTTKENVSNGTPVEPITAPSVLAGAAASSSSSSGAHPLAQLFGKYKDEPLWDEYMAEIEAYRRARNAQEDVA